MKKVAMALAIFTLALNVQAVSIAWDFSGWTFMLGDLAGIEQVDAYLIWGTDDADIYQYQDTIIAQLTQGTFNGTGAQIVGNTGVDLSLPLDQDTILHTSDDGFEPDGGTYSFTVLFLIQLKSGVVREDGFEGLFWFDPDHIIDYNSSNAGVVNFNIGDFWKKGVVPEPASGLLVALGGAALLLRRKRG